MNDEQIERIVGAIRLVSAAWGHAPFGYLSSRFTRASDCRKCARREKEASMSSGTDDGVFLDGSREATLKCLWERVEAAERRADEAGAAFAAARQEYAQLKREYQKAASSKS